MELLTLIEIKEGDSVLEDYGAKIRDNYLVDGYFDKWLVAINENNEYFVKEMSDHIYDIGTVCDAEMIFIPASFLPPEDYSRFREEYLHGI